MIWQVAPGLALGNTLLRLLQAAIPVLMLYAGKQILDEIVRLAEGYQPGQDWRDHGVLWIWVAAELILAALNSFLGRAISLTDSLLGDLVSNDSSLRIMRHAATLDLFQFEDPEFYDKLEKARTQTNGRTMLLSMALSEIQDFVTLLFLIGGLATYSPWLIAILALAVVPSFLGETHFNRRSYSLTNSWTPERRELDYLRFIGAGDQTAKEIKLFGLEHFLSNRFRDISRRYYLANRSLAVSRAAWGALFGLIAIVAYYAAYAVIVWQTVQGLLTLGTLGFLAGAFQRIQGLLQGIMGRFSRMAEMSLYLRDFFEFLEMNPLSQKHTKGLPTPRPIREGFVFENVGFRYPGSDRWALRGLNFTLKAGEKLALVGENGAGKTTIVKLLVHLYEPTEGRILLDGVPLCDYDPEDLRNQIGVIFQDYYRFAFTAAENIAIGDIAQSDNQPLIAEAARKSLADAVIAQLPAGYAQMLGKRFRDGVELSGGQWQKVALARAYMRDAQLIVLDEPTAALDARAENEVFLRFAELIAGKTGVIISHRFSTVRIADRILVLDNGQVAELGSHDELLQHGGIYAELFRLQAKGYA